MFANFILEMIPNNNGWVDDWFSPKSDWVINPADLVLFECVVDNLKNSYWNNCPQMTNRYFMLRVFCKSSWIKMISWSQWDVS